jgi:hypothetical protein
VGINYEISVCLGPRCSGCLDRGLVLDESSLTRLTKTSTQGIDPLKKERRFASGCMTHSGTTLILKMIDAGRTFRRPPLRRGRGRTGRNPRHAEETSNPRKRAFSQSVARLQHASNAAVGTLLRVMTDREAPAASRVRELMKATGWQAHSIRGFLSGPWVRKWTWRSHLPRAKTPCRVICE